MQDCLLRISRFLLHMLPIGCRFIWPLEFYSLQQEQMKNIQLLTEAKQDAQERLTILQ